VATARVFALGWLARTALLLLWSLVAWGALLLAMTLVDAVGEGVGPALARLLPGRGASVWAWLNTFAVALAVSVGLLAGGLLGSTRWRRARPSAS
jgi:hypothetical protein